MAQYNACTELLDRNIEQGRGDKIAYIDYHRSITYRDLQGDTCRVANFLTRLGLKQEDRVLMIVADTIEWPTIFLGAIRAGIVPIPVNTLLTAEQYAYMLADSRARVVFVSAPMMPVVGPILRTVPTLEHVVVVNGAAKLPNLDLEVEMKREKPEFKTANTNSDEPAFWLYSSGSTGAPKGTKHVHISMMNTAELFAQGVVGMREDDVVYSAAKLFFAYGLGNGLSFPLSVGATAVLYPDRPTPESVLNLLGEHQPTIFCGVPTLFASILHDQKLANHKGSSRLRLCTSAGEALPEHIGKQWEARFGAAIIDGVGSTEMLHIYLANPREAIVYGTSGMAVPGYELCLKDEAGHVLDGAEEVGELYVRGPSAAEGYWNQREKTRFTFQGDWVRTGDKYTRDASGRYTYCGRADDMFKVSGIWVSPFEVEAAVASHEAVLEAAVIAGEDDDGLLKPKAYVVLKDGFDAADLDEKIKQHVKAAVGAWKYPRWVKVVDSLPKTATGKIQRFKLREMD